jgi:probable rRNA maturation factor
MILETKLLPMTAQTTNSDGNPEPDSSEGDVFIADDWWSDNNALIEVSIEAASWPNCLVEDLKVRGPLMLDHIASHEAVRAPIVSLLLCGDSAMQNLNHQHRGFDKPTNVLSFSAADDWPGGDDGALIGDVAIAAETVQREAASAGIKPADHLLHLFAHGVLHLLGYDHTDQAMAGDMEALEIDLLAKLNVGNPYQDDNSDIVELETG